MDSHIEENIKQEELKPRSWVNGGVLRRVKLWFTVRISGRQLMKVVFNPVWGKAAFLIRPECVFRTELETVPNKDVESLSKSKQCDSAGLGSVFQRNLKGLRVCHWGPAGIKAATKWVYDKNMSFFQSETFSIAADPAPSLWLTASKAAYS